MLTITRGKVKALLAAVFLAVTLGTGLIVATPAHANSAPSQFCIGTVTPWCIDAWDGGPLIKVYNQNGGQNTVFETLVNQNDLRYTQIEFAPGGILQGQCIGDVGDNPNDARAGFVTGCGGSGIGWGGNFGVQGCASGQGVEFWDAHWNGWLGPQNGNGNGTQFYLNKPTPYCFIVYPV